MWDEMNTAPNEIDGASVLEYALLDREVTPTENTVHRVGGTVVGPAHVLVICKYPDDFGYYLFYCDQEWQVVTDTYHESLKAAKRQAEFEYRGVGAKWEHPTRR